MIKFEKEKFMDFIKETFTYDVATIHIISSLVDYGIKNHKNSVNELSYFLYDILQELTFEEINKFELSDTENIYKVEITETLTFIQETKANSEDEAIEKVREMYHNEEIVLDYNNFSSVDFKIAE